jgi:hypothetical protein
MLLMTAPSAIYELDYADRKELVVGLLAWLSAREQKKFLVWCCEQLPPVFCGTRIEGPIVGGAKESWVHLMMLCTQHGLDFEAARTELERRVRTTKPDDAARRAVLIPGVLGEKG